MKTALFHKDNPIAERLIFFGFCALFFFLPVGTSPAVIAGVFTLSVWIFSGRFVRDVRSAFAHDWALPVIIMMSITWAGMLYTSDTASGFHFAKKSYYWLYAFAIAGLTVKDHQKTFINAFLAGLSLSVALAMAQYAGLIPMPKGFMTGFFGGQNPYITYSLFLVLGLLILSFHYKESVTPKRKVLIALLAAAYFFNLALIPGRSGYLAFIVLSPLILINIFGKKRAIWAVAASLILIAALFSSSVVQKRLKLIVDDIKLYRATGQDNTSVGLRLHMWEGGAKIFLDNPIIGVGTGGYKNAMKKYKDRHDIPDVDHPHNSFFYVAVTHGIFGLAAFLWLLFAYLKKGWRSRHGMVGFAVLSFGLVLIIGSMTDTQYLSTPSGSLFTLLIGLRTGSSD
jgi:O-antigen ligase